MIQDFSVPGYKAVIEGDGVMLQEFKGMGESANRDALVQQTKIGSSQYMKVTSCNNDFG